MYIVFCLEMLPQTKVRFPLKRTLGDSYLYSHSKTRTSDHVEFFVCDLCLIKSFFCPMKKTQDDSYRVIAKEKHCHVECFGLRLLPQTPALIHSVGNSYQVKACN